MHQITLMGPGWLCLALPSYTEKSARGRESTGGGEGRVKNKWHTSRTPPKSTKAITEPDTGGSCYEKAQFDFLIPSSLSWEKKGACFVYRLEFRAFFSPSRYVYRARHRSSRVPVLLHLSPCSHHSIMSCAMHDKPFLVKSVH